MPCAPLACCSHSVAGIAPRFSTADLYPNCSHSGDSTDSRSGDTVSAETGAQNGALSSLSSNSDAGSQLSDKPFAKRFVCHNNSLFVLPQVLDEAYTTVELAAVNVHSPHLVIPEFAPATRAASRRNKNPN